MIYFNHRILLLLTINLKVEELEELNQALRDRDKMKDDAIAQLSDQVIALIARMQDFERKQSINRINRIMPFLQKQDEVVETMCANTVCYAILR